MEGTIISKLKSEKKSGYTLIEMVVVMGIIAIITLLGAYALIAARDYYALDAATEEVITAIRDAQNRSVSFMQSEIEENRPTKAWGIYFDDVNNQVKYVSIQEGASEEKPEGLIAEISSRVEISSTNGDHVYFASPFATTYLTAGACGDWEQTDKPSQEFAPVSCTVSEEPITITLEYNSNIRTVTINERGDVSAN